MLFEHERGHQAHLLLATGNHVSNATPHMLEFANALAFCKQILRLEIKCRFLLLDYVKINQEI